MVHGLNNPRPNVLKTYAIAAEAINSDSAINSRKGIVCVGYRWPSEKDGEQGFWSSWLALPALPGLLLTVCVGLVALALLAI